jgi:branched-chain amino acid transport system ATP-binding protein
MSFLNVQDVSRRFGGVRALNGVSFGAERGRVTAVIGPNGAGKTTLFNMISGMLRPDSGTITLDGEPIGGLPPHRIAQRGVSRTFQNVSLFPRMSVLENVMIGRHLHARAGLLACALRLPWQAREERAMRAVARRHIEEAGLADRADCLVGALSFGQRRMVEWARALATEPRLLLLDEPASGLNTHESEALASRIQAVRNQNVAVLLVEHDMSLVMDVADHMVVLNFGTPIASGTPAAVRANPEVVKVYLGGEF